MEVSYRRNKLEGAEAVAFREFGERARGTHYMQSLGWRHVVPSAGMQHRYIVVQDQGRIIGTASLLRGVRGPLRSPSAVIERGPVVADVGDLVRRGLPQV